MRGPDHGDHAVYAQRPERLCHDRASRLGRQSTSPGIGVKVIPQFHLGPAVLQWLQAAVTQQAATEAILNSPKAPTQDRLVLNLLGDLLGHVLAVVGANPLCHQRVQINLGQSVEVVGP